MDLDHAGGMSDFPAAQIHVTSAEAVAIGLRRGRRTSLPLRAMGAPTRHRRARSARREVARIRRRQGTRRNLARHCARSASRSHPRPCLRCRRCRPSLGAARRRCVLSLRHPRRPHTVAARPDGDGVPRRIRPKNGTGQPLTLSSCIGVRPGPDDRLRARPDAARAGAGDRYIGTLRHQYDLADVLSRREDPVGLTGFGERYRRMDYRLDDTVGNRYSRAARSTVATCRDRPTTQACSARSRPWTPRVA